MKYFLASGLIGFAAPFLIAMSNLGGEFLGHATPYESVLTKMMTGFVVAGLLGVGFSFYKRN